MAQVMIIQLEPHKMKYESTVSYLESESIVCQAKTLYGGLARVRLQSKKEEFDDVG